MAEVKVSKAVTAVTLSLTAEEAPLLMKLLSVASLSDDVSGGSPEHRLSCELYSALSVEEFEETA